ncbi:MAG: LysE family translocator [Bacteroidales bacterium]|nr:LysE family translocator [Bacteroidales bacterium]
MIYTVIWGILIGILVSAPLGPIGVLVIQRTLNKGRRAGLMTGLGAGVSDLFYALVSGLGLSFIVDFISANESSLQIVGSIVIFLFGFYLWKKNPVQDLNKTPAQTSHHATYFATGLILTLSNPLIIFFYLALYARTNFLIDVNFWWQYIIGYASIVVGALSWWLFITYAMNKARNHFNIRSLFLVNKIIALIMVIVSIVGFILGSVSEIKKIGNTKNQNLTELLYELQKSNYANNLFAGD